jgi:hypothetical protein
MYGFTSNYIKVRTAWNAELINQIRFAEITSIGEDGIASVNLLTQTADRNLVKA